MIRIAGLPATPDTYYALALHCMQVVALSSLPRQYQKRVVCLGVRCSCRMVVVWEACRVLANGLVLLANCCHLISSAAGPWDWQTEKSSQTTSWANPIHGSWVNPAHVKSLQCQGMNQVFSFQQALEKCGQIGKWLNALASMVHDTQRSV